jgi:hypothetical protein
MNGALDIAADLSTPERVLLFCLASGTEWAQVGVTGAIRACPPLIDREQQNGGSLGRDDRGGTF